MSRTVVERDGEKFRWNEDERIVSITAAPPGWFVAKRKTEAEGYDPTSKNPHDLAWFEPIACFAVMETMEFEERLDRVEGDQEYWEPTGRTERTVRGVGGESINDPGWYHTYVVPVALDSGEMHFPGADELRYFGRALQFDLIIDPSTPIASEYVRSYLT